MVHPSLFTFDAKVPIFEIINSPGIHIPLGIVERTFLGMEVDLYDSEEEGCGEMDPSLETIDIHRIRYERNSTLQYQP